MTGSQGLRPLKKREAHPGCIGSAAVMEVSFTPAQGSRFDGKSEVPLYSY